MFIENLGEIDAVAFDIDGTLYRNYSLNIRAIPYVIGHSKFFLGYNKTRHEMHGHKNISDFHKDQIEILSKYLKCTPEEADTKIVKIVHKGMEKFFTRIKPCKGALELIHELKSQGIKIALLSDLPPAQKGDIWGIKKYCDLTLWTEDAGALKPDSLPFVKMAEQLGVSPEKILYVGNNHKYDVEGAKNAGMKTAWIVNPLASLLGKKSEIADITFCRYKELYSKLLEKK